MTRPRRIAVLEISHWHALNDAAYLDVLAKAGTELVAVSDRDARRAQEVADRFGGKAFEDYRDAVERTQPDFVVALGRHIDMPHIFRFLVEAKIPFLMEKPWASTAADLQTIEALVQEKRPWVTAPFQFRHRLWAQTGRKLRESGELGTISHITFRMMRPSPERYVTLGSSWMLSKEEAGGGAVINLGSHGFDICRYITGEEPVVEYAVTSNRIHRGDVEDYAMTTLRTPSGVVCNIEVGYAWPGNDGDRRFEIVAEKQAVFGFGEDVKLISADEERVIRPGSSFGGAYPAIIADCLDRLERGDPPGVDPADCLRSLRLIHDAYAIARA